MKISGTGALVGAAVGGIARAAVVASNIGEGLPWFFVLPSAAIGVLVGVIAGGMGKPLIGGLVGALLSAVVFEFFMLPCASLFGAVHGIASGGKTDGESAFMQATLVYALEMGLAGFLAGGRVALDRIDGRRRGFVVSYLKAVIGR